jgi:hypothetical protein
VQILKSEISVEEFDRIAVATNIEPIILSEYAMQLVNALESSSLSLPLLREALYANGFKRGFDFILHFDAAFIEVTTRHL